MGGGFGEGGFCLVCLVVVFFEDGIEVGDDQLAYCGEGFVWQCDGCPVVFDELFGVVGLDCDEGAAVFSCLASEAVEVLVVVAEAVAGDFVAEG